MTNPKLALIPSGYKNSKVYSILPNDGSGDFTFARNSGGTRVNKQGLIEQMQTYGSQLLNNSDFTSTSDWTVNNTGSAASVIENGYLHINTSSDYTEATQSIGLTAGDTYRVDYEILESTAGTISIIGNGGASTIIPSTVGKHTIEYDAQAVFAVKRTTGSTNIKIAYIKVYKVQYNTPRLDWSDSNCPSLLLESQSTNLYPDSNDFSDWSVLGSLTLTSNYITSPSGEHNATRLQWGSGTNFLYKNISHVGNNFTNSFYIKSNTSENQYVKLFLDNGAQTQEKTITPQWQRFTFSNLITPTQSNRSVGIVTSSNQVGDLDVSIAFAQFEAQSFASSYIPTFAGTSTRLADVCSVTTPSGVTQIVETFSDNTTNTITTIPTTYTISSGKVKKVIMT